jgi:hypothetical protein
MCFSGNPKLCNPIIGEADGGLVLLGVSTDGGVSGADQILENFLEKVSVQEQETVIKWYRELADDTGAHSESLDDGPVFEARSAIAQLVRAGVDTFDRWSDEVTEWVWINRVWYQPEPIDNHKEYCKCNYHSDFTPMPSTRALIQILLVCRDRRGDEPGGESNEQCTLANHSLAKEAPVWRLRGPTAKRTPRSWRSHPYRKELRKDMATPFCKGPLDDRRVRYLRGEDPPEATPWIGPGGPL